MFVLVTLGALVLLWLWYLALTWDYSVKPDQRADAGAAAVFLRVERRGSR